MKTRSPYLELKAVTMTSDTLFSYGNMVAMAGWIMLAVSPLWKMAERIANGVFITLLSLAYAVLAIGFFRLEDLSQFGTLQGVKALFSNDYFLLTGWVHYLAFDLFVGCWMRRNARRHRVPHLLFVICGFFTFMLGPCGLVLYLIVRAIRTRRLAEVVVND
jgi:hypothetical protein